MQQLARHRTGPNVRQKTRAGSMSRDSIQIGRQVRGTLQIVKQRAVCILRQMTDEEPDCQAEDVLNRLAENDPGCHARSLDS
jgi:hypothetical protein